MGIYKATEPTIILVDITATNWFDGWIPCLCSYCGCWHIRWFHPCQYRRRWNREHKLIWRENFQQPSSHDRVHFLLRLVMVLLISKWMAKGEKMERSLQKDEQSWRPSLWRSAQISEQLKQYAYFNGVISCKTVFFLGVISSFSACLILFYLFY